MIDDEEAHWAYLKQKDAQEGNICPVPGNGGKRAKSSSKKQKNAFWDCAKEFRQKLNFTQGEYQKGFGKEFAFAVVRRVTM